MAWAYRCWEQDPAPASFTCTCSLRGLYQNNAYANTKANTFQLYIRNSYLFIFKCNINYWNLFLTHAAGYGKADKEADKSVLVKQATGSTQI